MSRELKKLGANIREIRLNQNISQKALAEMAGLSRTFIAQMERGARNASYLSISRVAQGLGVTKSDVMANADVGSIPSPHQEALA